MLEPYRVLDLTQNGGELGPMILADLGADVIRVEPPDGGRSRREGAKLAGAPAGLESLRYHVFNRNKRAVSLDLADAAGQTAFLELVRTADFLIEDAGPGAMDELGLGHEALRAVNPDLVYIAISPFGQDGPYANHRTTDLTLAAMGGMAAMNGEADRAPVRITVPQTWLHGAAESAVAAMVAHFRRLDTGKGQFADLSVQASVFWTGLNSMIAAAVQGRDIERNGTILDLSVIKLPLCFPCQDGEVVMAATGATMITFVRWMVDEGVVPATWLEDEDWPTYDIRFLTGQPITHSFDEVMDRIGAYLRLHDKADLLARGLAASITVVPVARVDEVLAFQHLDARGYWHRYTLPGGTEIRIPGPFVRPAKTPLAIRRPAPAPGEHRAEVIGVARERAALPAPQPAKRLPFEGLKVADFSWIGVGPITAKYFADHGATVVRIETTNPPDRLRGAGPHKDGIPGPNRSQFYASFNTSKKGIVLNLKDPTANSVAKELLRWCDIAIESFTPGTMKDLGLGYEVARELNPDIIMVSTCLMGQTGPAAPLAGYGYHAAGISGFFEVTGWPDRAPGGPFNAYTDVIAPHFLAAAMMAALDHRRRTGEGQYIEQAQMESALHFLAPEIANYQVSGTIPRRAGNDDLEMAPHGVYPCSGEDHWVAIACDSDAAWQSLARELGSPAWAAAPDLGSARGRLARRRELDDHLAHWTHNQDRYAVMEKLQAAGIPAGVVQKSSDLLRDPQFAHRGFYHPLVHGEMGEIPYEGHQFNIEGYPSGPRWAAPCLGQDTFEVLTEILGMSEEAAAEAMASGAVGV